MLVYRPYKDFHMEITFFNLAKPESKQHWFYFVLILKSLI